MSENDKAKFLIEEIKTSKPIAEKSALQKTQTTEVYYESGKVSMIRTNENVSANVKVIKDGKKGVVATNDVSSTDALKKSFPTRSNRRKARTKTTQTEFDVPCATKLCLRGDRTEKLYDRLYRIFGRYEKEIFQNFV